MEPKAPKIERKKTLEELSEKLKQEFAKFNSFVARKVEIDNLLNNRETGLLSADSNEKSGLTKEEKIKLKDERKKVAEEVEKQRGVYLEVKSIFKKTYPDNSDVIDEILYSIKK